MNQSKIIPLLFLGLLSISASPIVAKSLSSSGTIVAFWRMLLASFFLWCYSAIYYKNMKSLSSSNKIKTSIAGALLGIHFILFFEAVKITTIANATFLGTLAPFFTLMIEFLIFKRRYKKMVYLGMVISLLGIFIVLINGFDLSSKFTLGNIYAIFCSLAIGLAFLISEKVRDTEGTIEYTRMLYGIAALTIFIIGSFYTKSFIVTQNTEILGFIFLALIPTILGHNIFYYCVKFTTPTIVGTIPLGEPIIASFIAFFLFNEFISFNTAIGGALCIYGIFIILKNRSVINR
tara:strand:- start:3268 stop:4140 length:873 start_codon:yes stop_codon:yes gene_type:complete